MNETRHCPGELRIDGDSGRITGLASVFYRKSNPGTEYKLWEDVVERIMDNAFDRALAERDDVVGLFNHDSNAVLGRISADTMALAKSSRGLTYSIDPPDVEWVNSLRESIRRGDIAGSSFQFRVQAETWREEKELIVREVEQVELIDVGPVTFPAYSATNTKVRSELRAKADGCRKVALELCKDKRMRIAELLGLSSGRVRA